jgi:hypothetical protein
LLDDELFLEEGDAFDFSAGGEGKLCDLPIAMSKSSDSSMGMWEKWEEMT